MTAAALIEALQRFPQHLRVMVGIPVSDGVTEYGVVIAADAAKVADAENVVQLVLD